MADITKARELCVSCVGSEPRPDGSRQCVHPKSRQPYDSAPSPPQHYIGQKTRRSRGRGGRKRVGHLANVIAGKSFTALPFRVRSREAPHPGCATGGRDPCILNPLAIRRQCVRDNFRACGGGDAWTSAGVVTVGRRSYDPWRTTRRSPA